MEKRKGNVKQLIPFLYRPSTAAKKFNIPKRRVYELIKEGKLIAHNDDPGKKGIRILAESLKQPNPYLIYLNDVPILLYRPSDVAKLLDMSLRNVYRLLRKGRIIAHKCSKHDLRIDAFSVKQYVEKYTLPKHYWLE